MAAVFAHFEAYARQGSGGKPCIEGIVGEALRRPGYASHITTPKPPVYHFGPDLETIIPEIIDRTQNAVGIIGAPITNRTLSLLTFIVSWPVPRTEVLSNKSHIQLYQKWLKTNIEFFKETLGSALYSIIEHVDENYLHLHIYALPLNINGRFGLETISPPHKTQLEAQRARKPHRMQKLAFIEASRAFLDDYHIRVASCFDLDRLGPRRQRLSRKEWAARKKVKELIERKHIEEIERKEAQIWDKRRELDLVKGGLSIIMKIVAKNDLAADVQNALSEYIASPDRLDTILATLSDDSVRPKY